MRRDREEMRGEKRQQGERRRDEERQRGERRGDEERQHGKRRGERRDSEERGEEMRRDSEERGESRGDEERQRGERRRKGDEEERGGEKEMKRREETLHRKTKILIQSPESSLGLCRTTEDTPDANMKVKDMTFKEGQEFKIRVRPKDDACSFAINIGHNEDNIALHFNPRFDENIVVCNSMSGDCWGDEHRDMNFPFCRGEECKFYINFNMEAFYIKLPDGSMIHFPNRLGDLKYKHFDVTGDARIVGIKIK
ncbi:hypothetical protein WMY93_007062 [Mugilogobius chulae]|uniref:Galectin n=1 Tax=Mugilogobius chulae TaxID=88201 RepID=A0AAW0PM24_9GOBI